MVVKPGPSPVERRRFVGSRSRCSRGKNQVVKMRLAGKRSGQVGRFSAWEMESQIKLTEYLRAQFSSIRFFEEVVRRVKLDAKWPSIKKTNGTSPTDQDIRDSAETYYTSLRRRAVEHTKFVSGTNVTYWEFRKITEKNHQRKRTVSS